MPETASVILEHLGYAASSCGSADGYTGPTREELLRRASIIASSRRSVLIELARSAGIKEGWRTIFRTNPL